MAVALERADALRSRNAREAIPRVDFPPCDPPSLYIPRAGRERLITVLQVTG
jgi:hypothetical protein